MKRESWILAFCVLWGASIAWGEETADLSVPPAISQTSDGVRFGVWPKPTGTPAPVLFVLASTIEDTLGSPYYRQAGHPLAQQGYLCVSVDLPCHGTEVRAGDSPGLSGWRVRAEKREDFVADLTGRLTKVLDHLLRERIADPTRVAALGTSRGGFMALQFAAADSRVRCVAAFAPVTRLRALSEFRGMEEDPFVQRLDIQERADALADRGVFLVIGDRDARVGTDHVIELARGITTRALAANKSPRVDLHVLAQPKGHTTPTGSVELAATWLVQQLAPTP